jgi:hypothetical protein
MYSENAAQKSKLHNLQYDEGGNHMAETETERNPYPEKKKKMSYEYGIVFHIFC